jgi:hypothetical protein
MKRGHSGAVITPCINGVMKHADKGKGLLDQAELCELLYPVTPKVLAKYSTINTDAYSMELLYEPKDPSHGDCTTWALVTVNRMFPMLVNSVWNLRRAPDRSWIVSLHHWLKNQPGHDLNMMLDIYFRDLLDYSSIHGDPTLANVLYRENGELVITDPLPARGKIPGLFTVDLGKMLQSAMGWETEMFGWRYSTTALTRAVLRNYSPETQARAWFWAAVHCLRLLPYAVERRVKDWALTKATYAAAQARTFECYMRSTHQGA